MSALWQAAKRGGGNPADGRRNTSWEQCTEDGCTGRILRNNIYEDGPELCFAHANDTQRAAALTIMTLHKCVDVRGTVLTEQHVQEILGVSATKFYFRGCTFTGDGPFPGTALTMENAAPQRGQVTPATVLDFGEATFQGGADFRSVVFPGRVFFDDATFGGPLFLNGAHFQEQAWFLRATLTEGHFTETTFDRFAGFHHVRATASLGFTGSVFSGRTDFDDISAPAIDFTDATFAKRAEMLLSGASLFTGTHFDGGLDLRLSAKDGTASVRRTHFGASSTITTAALGKDRLSGLFDTARVVSLQETDVEKLSLVSVDLGDCLFSGALNLDKISLSGRIDFARFPKGWREARWFEHRKFRTSPGPPSRRSLIREDLFWRVRASAAYYELTGDEAGGRKLWLAAGLPPTHPSPVAVQVPDGPHLASLYRSLRKALEDAKNEPGAGDFYYGEMEVRRLISPLWSTDGLLLTLYWALSGYGQRASRALTALALLLGTLTVLLTGYGLADTAPPAKRITEATRTATPPAPQVITIDITGPRVTATLPAPAATPPVALDVTAVAPTLPPPDQRWTAARVQRAVRTLVTSLVPLGTDQRLTTLGGYLVLVGRVLGAVLLGLAVLAIRARVKR
ncbi:pentapeptide repeat-containing protein [Nocardia sp. NRRL S-836]|uniref:pentapeptide repeat-containing protein n=1 Tax=Nocardia sp. NRRL S-836 TaxID=1519492 RepID=UPI0006AE1AD9|nr:pentapeptide repeat-containing protein [Nocardia sp. NRRL S-836]KOV84712.1 hypothetical protein ADL03_15690 [Nocardia sp. NRRL S-836]